MTDHRRVARFALLAGLSAAAGADAHSFATPEAYVDVGVAGSVVIGDVTGDGLPDVVSTTTFDFYGPDQNLVLVHRQRDDGTLAPPTRHSYGGYYTHQNGLALADFDGDRIADIVVSHDLGIAVLSDDGTGTGAFTTVQLPVPGGVGNVGVLDVDRDGRLDIVGQTWSSGAHLFHGDGRGGFERPATLPTRAQGYNDLEVGDVDADGIDDLVVLSGQGLGGGAEVFRHDGVAGFRPSTMYTGDPGDTFQSLALGDFDGDGRTDFVFGERSNSPTKLWLHYSIPQGFDRYTIPTHDLPGAAEGADLDGDGQDDLAVIHDGWHAMGVYLQGRDGMLGEEVRYDIPGATQVGPHGLALGDTDNDGCADAVTALLFQASYRLKGIGCRPSPAADLQVEAIATRGGLTVRVHNRSAAVTSATPRLRVRFAPGGHPFVLDALPAGCAPAPAKSDRPGVDCDLASIAPGAVAAVDVAFHHKIPWGWRLPVDVRVVQTTRDPVPANNARDVRISMYARRLAAPHAEEPPASRARTGRGPAPRAMNPTGAVDPRRAQ